MTRSDAGNGTAGEVVVRPATAADLPRLHAIDLATRSTRSSPADPSRLADPERFRADLPNLLVAVVDGTVQALALLGRPSPLRSNDHVVMLQGLDVHPEVQRRGVGRRVLAAVLDEARRRGARRVTLRVLAPNEPARRLYASMGFVVEGVLVGEFVLGGVEVDDVLMARRLDDDPRAAGADVQAGPE